MTKHPRMRRVLRVFLASPGDLLNERNAMEVVVGELNRTLAKDLGWTFDLVRWEDAVPDAGRPQQVILDQADFDSLDVFVGLLWNRFGAATGKAASGTEEEFQLALDLWEKNGKPHIHFYFCQRPANLATNDDLAQKAQVLAFRDQIRPLLFYKEFTTDSEFVESIRHVLTRHLLRASEPSDSSRNEFHRHGGSAAVLSAFELDSWINVPRGPARLGPGRIEVQIDYDFLIQAVPVTNRDYLRFVETTGYMTHESDRVANTRLEHLIARSTTYGDHPVTGVNWYDASAYAAWLGARLPKAQEWEKAARGPEGRTYPWGDEYDRFRCNGMESGRIFTTPVRAYPEGRSPYGCWDMAGNVFEWCLDWTQSPRFANAPNSEKVNRGGSFRRPGQQLVAWYEESDPPDLRMADVGFRCVAENSHGDTRMRSA